YGEVGGQGSGVREGRHVAGGVVDHRGFPVGPGGGHEHVAGRAMVSVVVVQLVDVVVDPVLVQNGRASGFFDERRPVAQLFEGPVLLVLRGAGDRAARKRAPVGGRQTMERIVPIDVIAVVGRIKTAGDVARRAVAGRVVRVVDLV